MMALRSRRTKCGPRLSPGYLVEWAVFLSIVFVLAHIAGLREFTSVLSGTTGSSIADWELSAFLGVVYIALYLVFVVVVPVLILATAILKVWQKIVPEKTVNE